MPSGNVRNYIVLDKDLLHRKDLYLVEKVVYAYLVANKECEPESSTIDFCARFLDLSESEVSRAFYRLEQVGLISQDAPERSF